MNTAIIVTSWVIIAACAVHAVVMRRRIAAMQANMDALTVSNIQPESNELLSKVRDVHRSLIP